MGLTGPQFLEGVAGKDGVTFFRVGCRFYIKNKLKSEIVNNKKAYKQKFFFSVITKNLNWEILPKNEKPIYTGELSKKRRGLEQFAALSSKKWIAIAFRGHHLLRIWKCSLMN